MSDRKNALAVLKKIGSEKDKGASKLSEDKLIKRLRRRMDNLNVSGLELTGDELKLVKRLQAEAFDEAAENSNPAEAEKPKKGKKGKKADKPAKKETVEKPKAEKKPAGGGRKREDGGLAAFRAAFDSKNKWERQALVDEVVEKGGVSKWSVANYISLAKKGTLTDGLRIEEEKTDKGKFLVKVD